MVKIEYPTVVLPELLYGIDRNVAPTNQILAQTGGYPLRILNITLASGKLLYSQGVCQIELKVALKHTPDRTPVHASALHGNLADLLFHKLVTQGIKVTC